VTSWDSYGFEIVTPIELREPIQKAFHEHKKQVAADSWPRPFISPRESREDDLSDDDVKKLFE
jgi:hypothetical protein